MNTVPSYHLDGLLIYPSTLNPTLDSLMVFMTLSKASTARAPSLARRQWRCAIAYDLCRVHILTDCGSDVKLKKDDILRCRECGFDQLAASHTRKRARVHIYTSASLHQRDQNGTHARRLDMYSGTRQHVNSLIQTYKRAHPP